MAMRNLYWTVVSTKQPNSADAVRELRAQEIQSYNPVFKYRDQRGWHRRSVLERYLFVRIDLRTRWQSIHGTRGVRSMFLGQSGLPCEVSKNDVNWFRQHEVDGYFIIPGTETPVFRLDDVVRVSGGALEGRVGVYQGLGSRDGRAVHRVVFAMLGRPIELEVSARELVAA